MKIAANVELLEVKTEGGGIFYPVLAWDDKDLVLIDTGNPGEIESLRKEVEAAGHKLEDITRVFLTHQDMDHIGSAKALSEMGAELYAHEEEAPYIQGDKKPVRIAQMEEGLDKMDEKGRAFYERVKAGAPLFYAHIDHPLKDGEVLDVCGGIKILHTPGHMPGHMVLLLIQSNILVVGDAANIDDGKLVGANPQHTREQAEAALSFEKIKAVNAAGIVCYHGGFLKN
jgi:glyoxylase-like metal-dependent hydrolase (beta-lactamase superfamily II)